MIIEITSVSARSGGAEVELGVRICNGENFETKRIVLLSRRYAELSVTSGSVSQECFEELELEAEICRAVKRGMYILGYGASSKKNMVLKLRSKGFSREISETASEYLCELGYINEEKDAVCEAERCLKKYWGRRRISASLYEKGYSDEAVRAALESLRGVDFSERCAELIRKRFRVVPDEPRELQKLIASMVRYGYSSSEIKEALSMIN
ncbi:MAG: regulatory protein RecX [Clostridia bacterium]|nr:regulatory protein RecX [Clostridia bacterium]